MTSTAMAPAVCVLGMHRSGTSVAARMLNLLGVDLGPPDLVSRAGPDNPTGYWEHPAFVEINEQILAAFGGRWDIPPALPDGWPRDRRLAGLRDQAAALVASFAPRPLWGWKDPRTCLTLPFWQDLIGPMRYVHCVRNPVAVAASLGVRNAIGPDEAGWLWFIHTQVSLEATAGAPQLIVFYEDLLANPAIELRRLAAFIGHEPQGIDPSVAAAAEAFVERELCHHPKTTGDVIADDRISPLTKILYVSLRDEMLRPPLPDAAHRLMPVEALTSQRDRLAAEILKLTKEAAARTRDLETAQLRLAAIHRSRIWRLTSFLLRATGRVPARRDERALDARPS